MASMIKIVAASSLSRSIAKLDESEQHKLADSVHSSPGLNLDTNTANYCYDYLTSTQLSKRNLILWHDLLNNTTSHPKKNNIPQTVDQLIATLKSIPNLFCVVTCQRVGAPYIGYRTLSSTVIILQAISSMADKVLRGTLSAKCWRIKTLNLKIIVSDH